MTQFDIEIKRDKIKPEPLLWLVASRAHLISLDLVLDAPLHGIPELYEIKMMRVRDRIIKPHIIIEKDIVRNETEQKRRQLLIDPP